MLCNINETTMVNIRQHIPLSVKKVAVVQGLKYKDQSLVSVLCIDGQAMLSANGLFLEQNLVQ